MQHITNEKLTELVAAGISEDLANALRLMVIKYKEHCSKFGSQLSDEDIEDVVEACLIKSARFNPDKGKAFNYFLTIIGCQFSEIAARVKNRAKLKELVEKGLTGVMI